MAEIAKTLAGRVYHQIRDDIVDGVLPAGSKLRMEHLTKQYETGLSPLREALARLVGDSLVTTEGQRGFWVAPLSIQELEDISAVRSLIETEALSLSIEKGGDEWVAALTEAYEALSAAEEVLQNTSRPSREQRNEWETCNRTFHETLVSACGSPWLIKLRNTLYHQAERYRHISLQTSIDDRCLHDEHEAIFNAAIRRQTLKASRLTELHISQTTDAVLKAMREQDVYSANG